MNCPVAGECGGCALAGTNYDDQLVYKRKVLAAELKSWPALAGVTPKKALASDTWGAYRNRAKLAVGLRGGRVVMGLYRRGSNEIVDLAPCLVHRPLVQEAMETLRTWIERYRLAYPAGPVKYVDLREAVDGVHVTLVLHRQPGEETALPWPRLLEQSPKVVGIAVNYNPSRSSYVHGKVTETLHGEDLFLAPVGPGTDPLLVPASGFLQVNTSILLALHRLMATHLRGGTVLHDLYCGIGCHGLSLLEDREAVIGIDDHPGSLGAAGRNAHFRDVEHRCRFVRARVEEIYPALRPRHPANAVILNPGRSGCRPSVLEALTATPPRLLAYLSCNPLTLSRDLEILVRGGLSVASVIPVDMMPQTDQVEALALCEGP